MYIAVAKGHLKLGSLDIEDLKKKIVNFSQGEDVDSFINRAYLKLRELFIEGILNVLGSMEVYPRTVVLVGGGAALFSQEDLLTTILGKKFDNILIPEDQDRIKVAFVVTCFD